MKMFKLTFKIFSLFKSFPNPLSHSDCQVTSQKIWIFMGIKKLSVQWLCGASLWTKTALSSQCQGEHIMFRDTNFSKTDPIALNMRTSSLCDCCVWLFLEYETSVPNHFSSSWSPFCAEFKWIRTKQMLMLSLLFFLGMEHNFRKIATLNQGTPYDYNSVMQYHMWEQVASLQLLQCVIIHMWADCAEWAVVLSHCSVYCCRYAFSKNNQPTMVPIPNSNVSFGNAKEMSRNDIARLNTLYKCCEFHMRPLWLYIHTHWHAHAACLQFVFSNLLLHSHLTQSTSALLLQKKAVQMRGPREDCFIMLTEQQMLQTTTVSDHAIKLLWLKHSILSSFFHHILVITAHLFSHLFFHNK